MQMYKMYIRGDFLVLEVIFIVQNEIYKLECRCISISGDFMCIHVGYVL